MTREPFPVDPVEAPASEPSTPFDPTPDPPAPPEFDPGVAVATPRDIPTRAEPGIGRFVRFERGGRFSQWAQTGEETVEVDGSSVSLLVFEVSFEGRDPGAWHDSDLPQPPPVIPRTKTVRKIAETWRKWAAEEARLSTTTEGDA